MNDKFPKMTKRQARRAELKHMRRTQGVLDPVPYTEHPLEDIPRRNAETAAAGLTKGETACNRSACQKPLKPTERWWNTGTRAFYCRDCAWRINKADRNYPNLCVKESEMVSE